MASHFLTKSYTLNNGYYQIDTTKPFSESAFWELNRKFYQENGISAWTDLGVPHHLTSNSVVAKTYAEIIFGFLKDLATKGNAKEAVYLLELGSGQGRLAFHILRHLDKIISAYHEKIPPYCYILSDIVEDNLTFYQNHPQFQKYFDNGKLDLANYDAMENQEIHLRHSAVKIGSQDLTQPIIAIANYFFDSIPNDLFLIRENEIMSYEVALHTYTDPTTLSPEEIIKNLEFSYHKKPITFPYYKDKALNELLELYKNTLSDTHLFMPHKGIQCLRAIESYSKKGMMLLTLDKGFHEINDIDQKGLPEVITHGSLSLWVNYHAYITYNKATGGKSLFPSSSNFHLELGCFFFLAESDTYQNTHSAYEHYVNDFGPDDFNSLKKLAYSEVAHLSMQELLAFVRMSYYDSTFFIKLLPRIKQVSKSITIEERSRLIECLGQVWSMYLYINESYDLPYEIGSLFYDMGLYHEATSHFQNSIDLIGPKADAYYNKILCYYQLRSDEEFYKSLSHAKATFPNDPIFENLEKLDMVS